MFYNYHKGAAELTQGVSKRFTRYVRISNTRLAEEQAGQSWNDQGYHGFRSRIDNQHNPDFHNMVASANGSKWRSMRLAKDDFDKMSGLIWTSDWNVEDCLTRSCVLIIIVLRGAINESIDWRAHRPGQPIYRQKGERCRFRMSFILERKPGSSRESFEDAAIVDIVGIRTCDGAGNKHVTEPVGRQLTFAMINDRGFRWISDGTRVENFHIVGEEIKGDPRKVGFTATH